MLRISARTSLGAAGRPGLPRRTFQAQNRRKLLRCQAIMVSGLMTRADHQPFQSWESHAQRSRSGGASFGRFTERCRTPSWCRSARFSARWSAARDLKVADAAAANMRKVLSAKRGNCRRTRKLHVLMQFGTIGTVYGRLCHRFGCSAESPVPALARSESLTELGSDVVHVFTIDWSLSLPVTDLRKRKEFLKHLRGYYGSIHAPP